MGELGCEELEEALRLVRIAPRAGREVARIGFGRRLQRPHVELEPVAEALDAPEHAHGVALAEAGVEKLDVVPDARLDPPALIDELEREVRRSASRLQLPLACHCVDALDGAVLPEVCTGLHEGQCRLGPWLS